MNGGQKGECDEWRRGSVDEEVISREVNGGGEIIEGVETIGGG